MSLKNNPTRGMSNEEVTEFWKNKAIEKYGDVFDYTEIGTITKKKDPVTIICKKHGRLDTTFYRHIGSETGCFYCGDEKCRKSKTFTHEEYIERIDSKYPNKDWKILSEYEHNKIPLIIEDRFGLHHKITPATLLNSNSSPTTRSAIDKKAFLIKKFEEIHGTDKFDFSDIIFTRVIDYIRPKCLKHGEFQTKPNWLLNGMGCAKCFEERRGDNNRSNTEDFIDKCINKFSDPIEIFDRVDYKGAKSKIEIYCSHHEKYYEITPNDYLSGYRCYDCGVENSGYSRHDYIAKAGDREGIMYIIKCWNDQEEFYKIGRTFLSVKERFSKGGSMPYNYEVIHEHFCDPGCVFDMEYLHHRKYKNFKYKPMIYFAGHTECFTLDLPVEKIIEDLLAN